MVVDAHRLRSNRSILQRLHPCITRKLAQHRHLLSDQGEHVTLPELGDARVPGESFVHHVGEARFDAHPAEREPPGALRGAGAPLYPLRCGVAGKPRCPADDGVAIFDSPVIMEWLDAEHGDDREQDEEADREGLEVLPGVLELAADP